MRNKKGNIYITLEGGWFNIFVSTLQKVVINAHAEIIEYHPWKTNEDFSAPTTSLRIRSSTVVAEDRYVCDEARKNNNGRRTGRGKLRNKMRTNFQEFLQCLVGGPTEKRETRLGLN